MLTCSASMEPMPPLNMMGLIHSRRWLSGSWRPKERAKPGVWTSQGEETGSPPSLLSAHSVTHPVPPPVLGIYYPPYPSSLTSQHWFPKLVAIVRSPITGLNGNLEGPGKVPRILEARILPGQIVTW